MAGGSGWRQWCLHLLQMITIFSLRVFQLVPHRSIHMRSSTIHAVDTLQLKSSSDAKACWVRMATEKAQAPLGGACFLESSSREIQMSSSSFFIPRLYMLRVTSYGMGYPFSQLGSAVPAGSPSSFLCTPSLLVGRTVEQAEKSLIT